MNRAEDYGAGFAAHAIPAGERRTHTGFLKNIPQQLTINMIIRSYRQKASERLNFNNTAQAKRSAVVENPHTTCVSERRDIAHMPIADSHILNKHNKTA